MPSETPAPIIKRKWFTSDKEEVFIPGAGMMGMWLLIASLGMLFATSILAYLYIRFEQFGHDSWPPAGYPALPSSLWLSTVVIIASSISVQLGLNVIKQSQVAKLAWWLQITLGLGVLFLLLQLINWWQFYAAIPATTARGGIYLNMFYVLTALHGLHVLGGLIPLVLLCMRVRKPAVYSYSATQHHGISYLTMYWHFLGAVWLVLFIVLYLI